MSRGDFVWLVFGFNLQIKNFYEIQYKPEKVQCTAEYESDMLWPKWPLLCKRYIIIELQINTASLNFSTSFPVSLSSLYLSH